MFILKDDKTRDVFVASEGWCKSIFANDKIYTPKAIKIELKEIEIDYKYVRFSQDNKIHKVLNHLISILPNERADIYILDGINHWVDSSEIVPTDEVMMKYVKG